MVGGAQGLHHERLFEATYPEQEGQLHYLLSKLSPRWNVTALHFRKTGKQRGGGDCSWATRSGRVSAMAWSKCWARVKDGDQLVGLHKVVCVVTRVLVQVVQGTNTHPTAAQPLLHHCCSS